MDSKVLIKHFYFISIFFINCAPHIDFYGNEIDLNEENIYLSDLRDKKNNKFILVFKGHSNRVSNSDMQIRELTLDRYIKLIKSIYGYTDSKILKEETFGIISPRYYVTIKFE